MTSSIKVSQSRKGLNLALTILSLLFFNVCLAQQNLFNIPSGDITPKNKFFYQHQLNFYSVSDFESKSHLVYGLGKGWDVGVNLVDIPIHIVDEKSSVGFNDYKGRKPLYPLLMATAQKQFVLNEHIFMNVGTQIGPNLTTELQNKRIAHFSYLTFRWQPFKKGFIIAGPYYSNNVFTGGPEHTFGWMAGYEIPLTKNFALMGDFISGQHKKSVSTIGGVYNLGQRAQLCLAALVPYPNRELPDGLVVELNIFGWDFKKKH